MRHSIERRIEWVDTDAAGHQHNSVVMRFVEACEADLFRSLGLAGDYFPSAPRVRQEIAFLAKLYFGQQVTTTLTVEAIGTSSLEFSFEVSGRAHVAGDGRRVPERVAATGSLVTVHVPHGTERSAPWPAHIRAALGGTAP